jgi:hypothetical protein
MKEQIFNRMLLTEPVSSLPSVPSCFKRRGFPLLFGPSLFKIRLKLSERLLNIRGRCCDPLPQAQAILAINRPEKFSHIWSIRRRSWCGLETFSYFVNVNRTAAPSIRRKLLGGPKHAPTSGEDLLIATFRVPRLDQRVRLQGLPWIRLLARISEQVLGKLSKHLPDFALISNKFDG